MGSQFVDLNGDGHVDYLTATFDGSPHVAFGDGTGWMAKRRPYQAQAIREWGQATDRIVTKWNRSTL